MFIVAECMGMAKKLLEQQYASVGAAASASLFEAEKMVEKERPSKIIQDNKISFEKADELFRKIIPGQNIK